MIDDEFYHYSYHYGDIMKLTEAGFEDFLSVSRRVNDFYKHEDGSFYVASSGGGAYSSEGKIHRFSPDKTLMWESEVGYRPRFSSFKDSTLEITTYWYSWEGTHHGKIIELDERDGEILWEFEPDGYIIGIHEDEKNDRFVVATNSIGGWQNGLRIEQTGQLHILNREGVELSSKPVTTRINEMACAENGNIYVIHYVDARGLVTCYDSSLELRWTREFTGIGSIAILDNGLLEVHTEGRHYYFFTDRFDTNVSSGFTPRPFGITNISPNPFNPLTTISFDMNREGFAELAVYDLNGRKSAVLHSGELPTGTHSISWDASGHASGMYFVVLKSGGMIDTRKTILLK